MLKRKIERVIEEHLASREEILLVDGARQVGKTTTIREVTGKMFPHYIEINMFKDSQGDKLFEKARSLEDFYLLLSSFGTLGKKEDTIVFLDEIQEYPHLLTMLKFLKEDGRYSYIASGSRLGIALQKTPSIPMGSIRKIRMFPLDLEEFLLANGVDSSFIDHLRDCYRKEQSLSEALHERMIGLFRRYLLVGGLPEAVNEYLASHDIRKIRAIHKETKEYYKGDASKYDEANRLKIMKVYDLVPSMLEKRKKRVMAKKIEDREYAKTNDYLDEFEYLTNSGICLEVDAIANPSYPLPESEKKNLLKLYINDVGLLSSFLYGHNVKAILDDVASINLGSIYENAVASELSAHEHPLFYYDNRDKGEVDFLIDDHDSLSIVPIEVKSGKDYQVHSALNALCGNEGYSIKKAYVLSSNREIAKKGKIVYLPIYFAMFLGEEKEESPFF